MQSLRTPSGGYMCIHMYSGLQRAAVYGSHRMCSAPKTGPGERQTVGRLASDSSQFKYVYYIYVLVAGTLGVVDLDLAVRGLDGIDHDICKRKMG